MDDNYSNIKCHFCGQVLPVICGSVVTHHSLVWKSTVCAGSGNREAEMEEINATHEHHQAT